MKSKKYTLNKYQMIPIKNLQRALKPLRNLVCLSDFFMFYNRHNYKYIYMCVCKFQCFVRRKPTYSHSQGTFVQLVFQLLWLHSAVSLSSLACCNVHPAYLIVTSTNKHTLGHMLSSRIDQNSIEQLYNAPFSTNSTFTSSYRALLRFCGFLVASK